MTLYNLAKEHLSIEELEMFFRKKRGNHNQNL